MEKGQGSGGTAGNGFGLGAGLSIWLSIYAESIMAAVNLPPDFKEFLKLLNGHKVEDLDDLENLP
jgi:hypothetical protein